MSKTPGQTYYEIDRANWLTPGIRADGTRSTWETMSDAAKHAYERAVILRARDRGESVEQFLAAMRR